MMSAKNTLYSHTSANKHFLWLHLDMLPATYIETLHFKGFVKTEDPKTKTEDPVV